ncbi:right-handed parallel beta-helix repeat-containing protein [Arachnia propionica]|nr:right-handed parallel beta-helix repeat-containing protein [Arachnia propionica]
MSLSRRSVLAAAGALPAVALLAGMPADARAQSRRTYFVSLQGDDNAAGTSESAAWKTINRVNKAFADGQIVHGDTVLFQRGQRFFGEIPVLSQPNGEARLTIGAYGTGAHPVIMGYKVLDRAQAWSKVGDNLWQIDLSDTRNYRGNTSSRSGREGNIGFLRISGKEFYGAKKFSIGELRSQFEFHSDPESRILTVNCADNPAGHGVLAAADGWLIQPKSNTTVQGLDFIGIGGHGIHVEKASGVRILDNHVHHIGGSKHLGVPEDPTMRYGNGIEIWTGCSDVLVENNRVYDVYDVAFTIQGGQEGNFLGWRDVHIKGNSVNRCSQSFEVWSRGANRGPEAGHRNCTFTGNTCHNAGGGWGQAVRRNPEEGGVHLLAYAEELPMDVTISGNRFLNAVNAYMYRHMSNRAQMKIDNNTIQLKAGQKLQQQRGELIEQHAAWSEATGFDKNSRFVIA